MRSLDRRMPVEGWAALRGRSHDRGIEYREGSGRPAGLYDRPRSVTAGAARFRGRRSR
jgi:hypothetical protein